MKIAVLGGRGYIGSALVEHLKPSHHITSIDVKQGCDEGDLVADYNDLPASFFQDYDAVIHLSCLSGVQFCDRVGAEETIQDNILKFVRLVQKLDRQKFVYASTGAVYGTCGSNQAGEADATVATTLYDWSKRCVDDFCRLSNVEAYGLRLGSVFGASPRMRLDLVLNKCMDDIAHNRPVSVYGSNVWRPFLDVDDFCRAASRIIENEPRPGIYNLSSVNMDVKGVCEMLYSMYPDITFCKRDDVPKFDFTMNTNKFRSTYGFHFNQDIRGALERLRQRLVQKS